MKTLIPSKKIYLFLEEYLKLILGVVFVLILILSAFIYYQYVYLVMQVHPEPVIERILVDQETLEKVLADVIMREDNLSRVRAIKYFDPFND
ncbi:MAG: hypothetical protein CMI55_03560 [Parcubacteria group bacterium]|mgnify:CR=1 FL=1|jgi:hypothetical protein|nr:hypothetical protein [Parcubacteria group bacterium]|tara:strand:- start:22 stop:297 length:276 start_codon:yes stop_codon:yes gene_type:complete